MINKASPQPNDPANRRNYFRVNHDVLFDCRPVDAYSANNDEPDTAFDDSGSSGLAAELRRIDRDAAKSLKTLAEKDRVLGDYLQLLSNKIDIIARHTLLADSTPDPHAPTRINISEAGIAFSSDKAFYKGKFLAVRLIFLPGYVPIIAFAEVVRCQNKSEAPKGDIEGNDNFRIAARFHRLSDKDQRELARQIMKAQIAHRQARAARSAAPGAKD